MRQIAPRRRGPATALLTVLLAVAVTAGCSGSATTDATTAGPPAAAGAAGAPGPTVSATLPPEAAAIVSSSSGECGVAGPAIAAAFAAAGQEVIGIVKNVKVGSCAEATITTLLSEVANDAVMAPPVCEVAAKAAYEQGVTKVVIAARDDAVLMIGTSPDPDCKFLSEIEEQNK